MNNVNLIGRLGRDAEINRDAGKFGVVNFSVANDTGWGDNKKTNWIDVVKWFSSDSQREYFASRLTKGAQVAITGELNQQTWQDKQTGGNRSKIVVRANELEVVGGGNPQAADTQEPFAAAAPITDDDIPF